MRAKQLLEQIVKFYPNVVAIAQDKESTEVYVYFNQIPKIEEETKTWSNHPVRYVSFDFSKIIEWDSKDWRQKIVTINDLL